jgi:hypothetical protein
MVSQLLNTLPKQVLDVYETSRCRREFLRYCLGYHFDLNRSSILRKSWQAFSDIFLRFNKAVYYVLAWIQPCEIV